ncbi:MAG TPA: alpha-amylase family glycosyl hydrolase [Candidatus Cloacimonadota bacterium]|nr:alpha-amylase family glycosyl hydrolase [Candidatus Cloacimonadota bacterium]
MASIRFEYSPPTSGEHSVGLCADFTGWRIIDMPSEQGVYCIEFELKPGRYLYKFVVDGAWMPDPANPLVEADPFGSHNSVLDFGMAEPFTQRKKLDDFPIPSWVKEGIVYQIFPDRFCNGNPALNQDFSEDFYEGSRQAPREGQFLRPNQEYYHFVSDWKDTSSLLQSPWLPKGRPDWWSFYGGDLPGVFQKLDYLQDLGINIIYFNPLWPAKSNHRYDAASYIGIDPHLGSLEDFKELISSAHKRGIRIILDVAFNHTGETFWAFRDCVKKGPESNYWNWYDWKNWPLPDPLPEDYNPKDYYQCWWGIRNMPDLNYDLSRQHPEENDVHDIRYASPNLGLLDYLKEVCRWWLIEADIDGFRLDVPDEVPFWFWEQFRSWVQSFKPDAWLVGELWNNAQPWVGPKYFDSVMNYAYFKSPIHDYFIKAKISKDEFIRRSSEAFDLYPESALKAMMNLLGSHDTWRVWELDPERSAGVELAYLFQMTFMGVPHIYYGDEIGMKGAGDPDNRRPFDWDWERDPEAVRKRDFIKSLISLRKEHLCLTDGSFEYMEDDTLLRYKRLHDTGSLEIIINRDPVSIIIKGFSYKELEERLIYSHGKIERIINGTCSLGAFSALILRA